MSSRKAAGWRADRPPVTFNRIMPSSPYRYIGHGAYSLSEGERLTGVPAKRIRRWLEGYSFSASGKRRDQGPLVASKIGRSTGELSLTFADLLEVRFLEAFKKHGVSVRTIRRTVEAARQMTGNTHPFSTRRFMTDGKNILAEVWAGSTSPQYLDLARSQWVFARVVRPFLIAAVDFDQFDAPTRWWPLTKQKRVVIDPERAFGAPITADGGVPTYILDATVKAEGSEEAAAVAYAVPLSAVRHAVEFERKFAA
jgi:uncharacterized protein (DUF433 family)/DNA-binding transcriptional MerR regulator